MHIDQAPECREPDYLDQIVEPVLDIDVFRALCVPVLIDFQYLTRMPPAPDRIDDKLGVRAPAVIGWRTIPNFQVFARAHYDRASVDEGDSAKIHTFNDTAIL
jgi:hypothetical protein